MNANENSLVMYEMRCWRYYRKRAKKRQKAEMIEKHRSTKRERERETERARDRGGGKNEKEREREKELNQRDDFRFNPSIPPPFSPVHFYLSRSLISRYCCPPVVYANAVPLNLTSRVYARLRFVHQTRIRPRAYELRGGRLQLNHGVNI